MCRNIKPLYNFEPATTDEQIHDAALQFIRKVSGFTKPSKQNEEAFNAAVDQVSDVVTELFQNLVTTAPPRDRAEFEAKARARSILRFG